MKIPWKFLLLSTILGFVFIIFPQIDLSFDRLFFGDGRFFFKNDLFIKLIFRAVPIISIAYSVFILLGLLFICFTGRDKLFYFSKKDFIYLIFAFAIGPGLVVNVCLKDHFGRARPSQIVQFGGDKVFTPAFVPTDQTEPNGSFVCGHSAAGFSLVALALLLEGRKRRWVIALALFSGSVIGLVRIAQGGHFLSDVIFSFVFVYLISYALYAAMYRRSGAPSDASEQLPLEVA